MIRLLSETTVAYSSKASLTKLEKKKLIKKPDIFVYGYIDKMGFENRLFERLSVDYLPSLTKIETQQQQQQQKNRHFCI